MKEDILTQQHPIYKIVRKVAEEKQLATFAVGGVVRDLFLNRFSKDIDILVLGSGTDLAQTVAKEISPTLEVNVFKNFGTAQFVFEGAAIEFVGARKESYDFNSRKPTVETGTLEEDLSRRDFTVNAMAIGISGEKKGELVDMFNGFEDLQAKILRTPLDPDITFSDDPLRILRAVRFASQLNFTIETSTLAGLRSQIQRLDIVSKERVVEELHKILLSKKPSVGLFLLDKIGAMERLFPWLVRLKGIDAKDGYAHKDNFLHTIEVVDKISLNTSNLWLIWAALLHDVGKSETKKYIDGQGWTFHQHEFVGAKMIPKIFKSLRMPLNEKMEYVKKLVFLHLRPIALVEDIVTDSAIRRLLFDAGDDIDDLMLLCEADVTSSIPEKIKQCMENFANVRQKLKEIEEKDRIRNWQPPIDGELIMKTFNLSPCREVGIIKDAIREAILEGIIPNEFDAAYQMMIEEGEKLKLKKVTNHASSVSKQKESKDTILDRKTPPPIHERDSCTLSPPQNYLLSNKIPLYLFFNPNLDLIHIRIKVKAGALYEPIKFVAHSAYQLLKESNAKLSTQEMDDFLAFHGASWKTYINTQFITIQWIIPKKNIEKVLPVLWETISNPSYRIDDLQRFKESKIKDLEYNQAKFNYRATQLMFAEMFPAYSPIGTILTKEHIEAITIEQLQKYHQQTFTESKIRVFATGNIEMSGMRYVVFGEGAKMRRRESEKEEKSYALTVLQSFGLTIDTRPNALQSSFILCRKNIGYVHNDRRNFEVLSVLFGGYFGSRLMQNLREENGYTYGIFCSSLFYENESIFYIEADVKVEKTKDAIEECFKEMKWLQTELVDEEDISLVKSYMLGELLRDVDGSVSYQKKYAFWNDFQLDETEMKQMIDSIHAITPQVIQKLAKQYLVPETFSTIVVGRM
jgi:poly(A) polymerase